MQRARLIFAFLLLGFLLPGLGRSAASAPRLSASAAKVGKYEKIEFQLTVDGTYRNPYDPEEVDLSLKIEAPGGQSITLPAFYAQPYEYRRLAKEGRRNAEWFYPSGPAIWLARFAPMATGAYRCTAKLKDKTGTAESNAVTFECAPSASKGFVRVAKQNPRFFEFSEGGSFFPIGQDVAFIGDGQYVDLARTREIFQKMGRNGANYARVWTSCSDYAMCLEFPRSAFGRSWEKSSPVAEMPGQPGQHCIQLESGRPIDVNPSHPTGLKPATRYVLSGRLRAEGGAKLALNLAGRPLGEPIATQTGQSWTAWQREFTTPPNTWRLSGLRLGAEGSGTAWVDGLSLKENGSGPEILWEADVNRPRRGWYNPQDCFMLDQVVTAAEENGIKLQLCLLERNLYMDALKKPDSPEYDQAIHDARNLLRYAVARWGYSTTVATWEYWNEENPGLPTDRFYAEAGNYLAEIDPYHHLRATSAWGPAPKDWRHPQLDVADLHHYLRPTNGELSKNEVAAVLERVALVRKTAANRPALLSEFGLADDKWGLSPYMKQDTELHHLHNSLWASALSGLSGATMFWWWEQLDQMDAYPHYKPVAAFVADIPFATAPLQATTATCSDSRVRVIGLQTDNRADIWLFNNEAAWAQRVIDQKEPGKVENATLEIRGLDPGFYVLEWWDTATGHFTRETMPLYSPRPGEPWVIRCPIPTFTADLACKVRWIPKK